MNRKFIFGALIAALVFVFLCVVIVLVSRVWTIKTNNPMGNSSNPNAFSGSTSTSTATSTPGTSTSNNTVVKGRDGSTIPTKDFVNNGQTAADPANAGNYLVQGSFGYCTSNMKCTAGTDKSYNIFYNSKYDSFTISLNSEPLGATRLKAEQYLMQTLGITKEQMCYLNYYVGTTYFVNESYDSGNLGFSFCPGATPLP